MIEMRSREKTLRERKQKLEIGRMRKSKRQWYESFRQHRRRERESIDIIEMERMRNKEKRY